jgi:hypothetical protein
VPLGGAPVFRSTPLLSVAPPYKEGEDQWGSPAALHDRAKCEGLQGLHVPQMDCF